MNKKVINQLLLNGKKSVSEKIWIKNVKLFQKSFKKNYKKFVNRSIVNVAPLLKVKQLKQKKKRFQSKEFPFIVTKKARIALTLKFFINKKKRIGTTMDKKLLSELLFAAKKTGTIITTKKNLYEHAFIKKKYFYYR